MLKQFKTHLVEQAISSGLQEFLWWISRFGGERVRTHMHTPKSGTF
jgi:hypothetical protein